MADKYGPSTTALQFAWDGLTVALVPSMHAHRYAARLKSHWNGM